MPKYKYFASYFMAFRMGIFGGIKVMLIRSAANLLVRTFIFIFFVSPNMRDFCEGSCIYCGSKNSDEYQMYVLAAISAI